MLGSVAAAAPPAPSETRLGAPVPNPASGRVTLALALAEAADIEVTVVDVRGRTLTREAIGGMPAGVHPLTVETGALAPGTYVVRVRVGDRFESRPFVVVR